MSRIFLLAFSGIATLLSPSPVAADFAYPDFSSTSGLQLNGDASQAGDRLRLTESDNFYTSGSAFRSDLQSVAGGFSTRFQFQISQPGGLSLADGFTFLIQNAPGGPASLGDLGGYLGYAGVSNSVAVEFDLIDNGPSFGDPAGPHVAVHTNGTGVNGPSNTTLVGNAVLFPGLADEQVHTALINYTPGKLSLYVDDLSNPLLTVALDLNSTLSLSNGGAYVGFTSGTGAGAANHDILNWSFQPQAVPEPSSMLLLGLGLFGVVLRRRSARPSDE